MERRKAITAAAAASLTLLAGAAGIALNSGIVGAGDNDVGRVSPVGASTNAPITLYVEDPAAVPPSAAPPLPGDDAQPLTASASSGDRDDDGAHRDDDDRDEREGDGDDHDDHEDGDEYEGAEDDD